MYYINYPDSFKYLLFIFFSFILWLVPSLTHAQNDQNTVTNTELSNDPEKDPNILYKKAEELQKKNSFFEASKVFRLAAFYFYSDPNKTPQNQTEQDAASWHIKSRINAARALTANGAVQESMDSLRALIPITQKLLGEISSSEMRIYNALAQGYEKLGDYKNSLEFYQKTLNIILGGGEKQINVALLYYNIGVSYDFQARYDSSLYYKRKSLKLQIELKGSDRTTDIADCYSAMGVTYDNLGDYDNAALYYQKALSVQTEILGDKDPALAATYDNLGVTYDHLGDPNNARKYKLKALSLREGRPGPQLAISYLNIGEVYSKEKKYEEASKSYQSALNYFQQFGDELNMAACYANMGADLEAQKKYSQALGRYEACLTIRKKLLGNKHQLIADAYIGQGLVYLQSGDIINAQQAFQSALIAVVYSFEDKYVYHNPEILQTSSNAAKKPDVKVHDILSLPTLFRALKGKASTFFRYAADYNKGDLNNQLDSYKKSLHLADTTFQLAFYIIQEIYSKYRGELSKLRIAEESYQMYDDAISINQKLALLHDLESDSPLPNNQGNTAQANNANLEQKHKRNPYLRRIFTISEYSKSSVLQMAIQEAKIKRESSNIPDDIKNAERNITARLGSAHKNLASELIKGVRGNKQKISELQHLIFQLKNSHDSLINVMQSKNANISSNYNIKDATVSNAQNLINTDLKTRKQTPAFVEYFTGDSLLSIIYISGNNYHITSINYNKSEITKKVELLRSGITNLNYKRFCKNSYELYNQLIKPIIGYIKQDNITQLIIVPDNFLCYLPFETLIENAAPQDTSNPYHQLDYLIKQYAISYAYSFNLVQDEKKDNSKITKKFFGLAPVFKEKDQAVFGRQIVSTLEASEDEVVTIKQIADSSSQKPVLNKIFINSEATKDKIQSNDISQYEIIHLATHGFVYPDAPDRSGVLLYPSEGKDGMLYCNDIVALNLNADLVTLSACETGLGKIQRGEGIVGLTRAFLSAGASNIIVSLWSVADESTSFLMQSFYKSVFKMEFKDENPLEGNKVYAEALKRAKKRLITKPKLAAPFYWAPFILIE